MILMKYSKMICFGGALFWGQIVIFHEPTQSLVRDFFTLSIVVENPWWLFHDKKDFNHRTHCLLSQTSKTIWMAHFEEGVTYVTVPRFFTMAFLLHSGYCFGEETRVMNPHLLANLFVFAKSQFHTFVDLPKQTSQIFVSLDLND